MRANYAEFKSNLRTGLEETQNPVLQTTLTASDMLRNSESPCAQAIKYMEAYDAYFDFGELEAEATDIFKEFYCNFLSGNLEYLEKVSGGPALAICKLECKRR